MQLLLVLAVVVLLMTIIPYGFIIVPALLVFAIFILPRLSPLLFGKSREEYDAAIDAKMAPRREAAARAKAERKARRAARAAAEADFSDVAEPDPPSEDGSEPEPDRPEADHDHRGKGGSFGGGGASGDW